MLILSVLAYYKLLLINIIKIILFLRVILILLYNILIARLRRVIIGLTTLLKNIIIN